MLIEHFVDPEFLIVAARTHRNYVDFNREFDRQSPRVVGKLQKFSKFRRNVLQTQGDGADEEQKGRLLEILNFIEEVALVDRSDNFDGSKTYLENFIAAHSFVQANAFCLGQRYQPIIPNVIHLFGEDFDSGIKSLSNQLVVQKSMDMMISAVSNFLRLSKRIIFVDPYFSDKARMFNPMVAFIKAALSNTPVTGKSIHIMYKSKAELPSVDFLLYKLVDEIKGYESCLTSLSVTSLVERDVQNGKAEREMLHNRYMLSDLGGLIWGIGLDEQHSEISDDVALMNNEIYTKRYKQYADLTAFDEVASANKKFEI